MPSIKTYDEHAAILVTNQSKSISGNDSGNLMASTLGVVPIVTKTSNYTATENDEVIIAASSCATVTLPAVASTRVGKQYTIYHARGIGASASVRVVTTGADTIEPGGGTAFPLCRNYDFMTLVNRSDRWEVIADKGVTSGLIFPQVAAVTVASTASETTLMGAASGGITTLPADFYKAYTILKVQARGYVSNTGTPTLRMKFKHGATILVDTTAITTASGLSNTGWEFKCEIVCRGTGGSGTVMAQGDFNISSNHYPMVNTSTSTIDTTATQAMGFTAQWGTSSASNTITCEQLIIEVLR